MIASVNSPQAKTTWLQQKKVFLFFLMAHISVAFLQNIPLIPESSVEGDTAAKSLDEVGLAAPKRTSELNKLWKTVESNPADFTGWTYLLQVCSQTHFGNVRLYGTDRTSSLRRK